MTTWLTETEFRQSGAKSTGVTINVAFLQDIKNDNVQFKEVLQSAESTVVELGDPRVIVEKLIELQDELETHFALEEFFGYFQNAPITHPAIGVRVEEICGEHQSLFLQLNRIVELAEKVLYRESVGELSLQNVVEEFSRFRNALQKHEDAETELMLRLCNEDIGVGD